MPGLLERRAGRYRLSVAGMIGPRDMRSASRSPLSAVKSVQRINESGKEGSGKVRLVIYTR